MKKIFLFIFLLFFIIRVNAYENEYFSIDLPNDYTNVINENTTYKWEKDNNFFLITITDNTKTNYNISKFNENDINNQKKYIEDSINKSINDYNISINVNKIEKTHFNNSNILKYYIYWPSKDIIGYNQYQIGNIFTSKRYIITFIYSSDTEIDEKKEYSKFLNSLIIKDDLNSFFSYKIVIFIICVILSVFSFIKVILDKKK